MIGKTERFARVIAYFLENMPVAETELEYRDPFHLLVAVILSAQCTDKRVNQITPALLEHYPDPFSMASAEPEDVFPFISSCSYPNNKSKHLVHMARKLVEWFDGKVPADLQSLQRLPGVGRKTANVIASVVYDQPVIAVDTHVFRVAARIGLSTDSKTPLETERQLMEYIPPELAPKAHHWLILHGRYVCKARNPGCSRCGLTEICDFYSRSGKQKEA